MTYMRTYDRRCGYNCLTTRNEEYINIYAINTLDKNDEYFEVRYLGIVRSAGNINPASTRDGARFQNPTHSKYYSPSYSYSWTKQASHYISDSSALVPSLPGVA